MSARTQATIAIPIGARSVPGVVARARVTARIAMASLPLGQAGQYLQQVLDGDDGQDDDDDPERRSLTDILLGKSHLVDEERQVGARGARTTLGGHVDAVELLDDVDGAEQRPELDEAIQVGQDDVTKFLDPRHAVYPRGFA